MTTAERDRAGKGLAQRVASGRAKDEATLVAEAEAIGVDPRSILSYARNFLGASECKRLKQAKSLPWVATGCDGFA